MSIGKPFAVHLAEQENPHGSTLEKGMMEQMATPLTLFTCACQADDATGVTRCPSWIKAQSQVSPPLVSLCLSHSLSLSPQLSPNSTSVSSTSSLILFSFPFFQFLLPVPTSSQRSVGYIHRPGEGMSTAAKEKADISVSLRGPSRWLLQ